MNQLDYIRTNHHKTNKSSIGCELFLPDVQHSRVKLLTDAEYSFYRVLKLICGDVFDVSAKVRIMDLVKLDFPVYYNESVQYDYKRPFMLRHVDFVLTYADSTVLCAVELNDKSHTLPDRIKRDKSVERFFSLAQLPLVWIPAKKYYNPNDVAHQIALSVLDFDVSKIIF